MDRLTSIICAVDFTPSSASALAQAARIAKWNQAKLHVVHVIETLVSMEFQEALTPYVEDIEKGLLGEARSAWASFAPDVPGKASMDFEIAINNPLVEIVKRIRDRKADLLVMGSHGVSPANTTGILAAQCVRRSPTRVLLVRDRHTGPYKNIVACVDFSETSRDALDAAARIAAQDSATLHVLHVFHSPWKSLRAPAAADLARAYYEGVLERLEKFCTPARPNLSWVKPHFDLVESSGHGAAIANFVRTNGCDLTVLGTRGRTNLRDVLMGSTAERVVRDAPCSILAIKPEDSGADPSN